MAIVVGFGGALVRNVLQQVGPIAGIATGVAVAALCVAVFRKSHRIFGSLTGQASTLLTLEDHRLTSRDPQGNVLGTIDLAADFERSTNRLGPNRRIMILRQGEQLIEFNSEIEGRRELVAAIIARRHPAATEPHGEDPENVSLRFDYPADEAERRVQTMRNVRNGCVPFGVLFFALLAYGFLNDGRVVIGSTVAAVGVLVIGWFLKATHNAQDLSLRRATHYVTFESPSLLRSHDEADAPLGTIDLDLPFQLVYRNTQFRFKQDEQVVEFETELDGAEDLVTWIIGRPFRDPSS